MDGIRPSQWKWWSGGGVIAAAVVLGCASAVEFKESAARAPAPLKHAFTEAHVPGREPAQNGGKVRMPVAIAYDINQESEIVVSDAKAVVVAVSSEADITGITGEIVGADGLEGQVREPIPFSTLAAGEMQRVRVYVPAKTGTLVLNISGVVGGSMPMSTSLELKVINPKEIQTSVTGVRSLGVSQKSGQGVDAEPLSRDSNGQFVQPMKATEE